MSCAPAGDDAATGTHDGGAAAWVYVLRCADGSLYTGWSNDIPRRMARHREGRASRYTASRRPLELVLALPMADRSAAMREERRIKALPRPHKLALIAAAEQPVRTLEAGA
ncbi:MAG TPA: GIY-YIG nuclease family protein [Solirubrobacteraceae bacterium]|nr:GIY-YIG nuclease family protein [Solirubrobacteraceae bacterium]